MHGGSVRRSGRSRYRQWMTHKLVDVDRPVRDLGLRRLRALHHVVPGRDRHHRGGGRDPRDRPARRRARCARLSSCIGEVARAGRAPGARTARRSPAARATACFDAGRAILREGEPADTFFVSARARSRSRPPCPGAAPSRPDPARRRPARLVVARAALPHRVRRGARGARARDRARRRVPARQVRRGPGAGLRAAEGASPPCSPSACRTRACGCSTSTAAASPAEP